MSILAADPLDLGLRVFGWINWIEPDAAEGGKKSIVEGPSKWNICDHEFKSIKGGEIARGQSNSLLKINIRRKSYTSLGSLGWHKVVLVLGTVAGDSF